MKFRILKPINMDLKNFSKNPSNLKIVEAGSKVYEVKDDLAKELKLAERFAKYPNHIAVLKDSEKTEEVKESEDVKDSEKPLKEPKK